MKFRLLLLLTVCLFFITSCNESKEQQLMRTLKEWEQKEILFPLDIKLSTVKDGETKFTFPVSNYKVLIYVDSMGCISCKLKMDKWLEFMSQINSVSSDTVPFLFFFHPRSEQEIRALLKVHKIDFPFCIDMNDKMNKLNNFPDDLTLQTFLLDKNNRVKIVGNPIYNLKLKKLYLRTVARRFLLFCRKKSASEAALKAVCGAARFSSAYRRVNAANCPPRADRNRYSQGCDLAKLKKFENLP